MVSMVSRISVSAERFPFWRFFLSFFPLFWRAYCMSPHIVSQEQEKEGEISGEVHGWV